MWNYGLGEPRYIRCCKRGIHDAYYQWLKDCNLIYHVCMDRVNDPCPPV
ncbi:MAG: hypothetical protein M2R45_05009 [Verrucomicrobia subdivision 3 bacterium]|nr:hypothetical protein [Limisphaerales bacterium]